MGPPRVNGSFVLGERSAPLAEEGLPEVPAMRWAIGVRVWAWGAGGDKTRGRVVGGSPWRGMGMLEVTQRSKSWIVVEDDDL